MMRSASVRDVNILYLVSMLLVVVFGSYDSKCVFWLGSAGNRSVINFGPNADLFAPDRAPSAAGTPAQSHLIGSGCCRLDDRGWRLAGGCHSIWDYDRADGIFRLAWAGCNSFECTGCFCHIYQPGPGRAGLRRNPFSWRNSGGIPGGSPGESSDHYHQSSVCILSSPVPGPGSPAAGRLSGHLYRLAHELNLRQHAGSFCQQLDGGIDPGYVCLEARCGFALPITPLGRDWRYYSCSRCAAVEPPGTSACSPLQAEVPPPPSFLDRSLLASASSCGYFCW